MIFFPAFNPTLSYLFIPISFPIHPSYPLTEISLPFSPNIPLPTPAIQSIKGVKGLMEWTGIANTHNYWFLIAMTQKYGILQEDTRNQNGKPRTPPCSISSTYYHYIYTLPTPIIKRPHTPLCVLGMFWHTQPFPQQSLPVSLCLSSFWRLRFRTKFSKMYSCIWICWIKRITLNLNTDLYCATIQISLLLFLLVVVVAIITNFTSAFFFWSQSPAATTFHACQTTWSRLIANHSLGR